nr:probable manganese-transporting ATPase PDR2 [Tanacetum cinerariifolium]
LAGSLTEEIYFDFQKQRFIYSHEKGTFYKLPYPTKETFGWYLNSTGYDTDAQVQIAADKWGRNVIEYPQTTFWELMKEHCMDPYFYFRWRRIHKSWSLHSLVFLAKSLAVIRRLKTLSDSRRVRADSRVLMVYRNGEWIHVAGTDLVPEDIVSIGRFVRQDTKKKNLSLQTCLLLKTFHIKAPDTGCIAIVLRTGFKTNQGKLIRTCLFSREKVTAKSWERGLFSLLLVFSAIIAVAHLLKK